MREIKQSSSHRFLSTPKPEAAEAFMLPLAEIRVSHARSSGAGGQNVNKVNTKVIVKWNINRTTALTEEQKELVKRYPELRNRISSSGVLTIHEQRERSQAQNLAAALEKLTQLVREALTPEAERIPTEASASSGERRLREKDRRAERKQNRKPVHWQD